VTVELSTDSRTEWLLSLQSFNRVINIVVTC